MIKGSIQSKIDRVDNSLRLIKKASEQHATVEDSVITILIEDLSYLIVQLNEILVSITSVTEGKHGKN